MPFDHKHVLADWHMAEPKHVQHGDQGRARRAAGVVDAGRSKIAPPSCSRRPSCSPRRWRADGQRGDDARTGEDGVPVGDRRGLRADRFLALQRRLRAGALSRAADQRAGRVESARVPAARGLRLRGVAVQLHGHRRQPLDGAGAHGRRVDLEAGVERDAERVLRDARARGGGPAAGRHQLPAGQRRHDHRRRCWPRRIWRAFTSRAAPKCSRACGRRSARTSRRYQSYPRLVGETGGKDFIVAHPSADAQAVAVAIVRGGFEYQGQKCSAASRIYVPQSLWKDVRDRVIAMMKRHQDGRRARLPQFHERGHRQEGVRQDQRLHRRREEEREDPPGRQGATTRRATSSSRRSCRRRTPATSCCARRSSDRS